MGVNEGVNRGNEGVNECTHSSNLRIMRAHQEQQGSEAWCKTIPIIDTDNTKAFL